MRLHFVQLKSKLIEFNKIEKRNGFNYVKGLKKIINVIRHELNLKIQTFLAGYTRTR